MKRRNKIGMAMAIGVSIGAALGVAFHALPIGVGAGVALGAALGLLMSKSDAGSGNAEVKGGDQKVTGDSNK